MSGIALEVMPDSPPQVGITLSGMGTAVVTVDVSWDAGDSWHGVRGARNLAVVDSAFVRDFVCPLNVEAIYRLTIESGTTPTVTAGTITVPSDSAWIQDPLNPRGAVAVDWAKSGDDLYLLSPSMGDYTWTQPVDLATVEGADLPVASVGTRQGPSGIYVHLRSAASAQGALVKAIDKLLKTSGQVVLRGLPADLGLDPVAHVIAPEITRSPIVGGLLGPRRDWEMTLTQARPTAMRVVVPWWTYGDVTALWTALAATYASVLTARPGDTYLDWLKNPTPGG